jgi:hypothetical protein
MIKQIYIYTSGKSKSKLTEIELKQELFVKYVFSRRPLFDAGVYYCTMNGIKQRNIFRFIQDKSNNLN